MSQANPTCFSLNCVSVLQMHFQSKANNYLSDWMLIDQRYIPDFMKTGLLL